MLRLLRLAALAAVAVWPAASFAEEPFDGTLKIGLITDMTSLYADVTGPGSLLAGQMAVEDYLAAHPNSILKPTILNADHQNKPDIAVNIVRQWIDQDHIDVIADVPNSAVALAISEVAKAANKVHLNASAGTARLTGDACNANTVQWNFDNYALANVTGRAIVATGGDSWFFLTSDYAFGHDLEAQTMAVVKAQGGTVVGAVRHPLNTQDFSSFLLQAQTSGAKIIGLANAGGDTINSIKQAVEFGITAKQKLAALLIFITDVNSLGLKTAQGLQFTEAFYWDMNDDTRAWTARFIKRHKNYPTSNQAATYSSILHLLKAAEVAKTHDGQKLVAQMKAMPTEDPLYGKGAIRQDGRKVHPMHLFQVKSPAESKGPWDYYKLIKTVPIEEAWRPLAEGGCPLVSKS